MLAGSVHLGVSLEEPAYSCSGEFTGVCARRLQERHAQPSVRYAPMSNVEQVAELLDASLCTAATAERCNELLNEAKQLLEHAKAAADEVRSSEPSTPTTPAHAASPKTPSSARAADSEEYSHVAPERAPPSTDGESQASTASTSKRSHGERWARFGGWARTWSRASGTPGTPSRSEPAENSAVKASIEEHSTPLKQEARLWTSDELYAAVVANSLEKAEQILSKAASSALRESISGCGPVDVSGAACGGPRHKAVDLLHAAFAASAQGKKQFLSGELQLSVWLVVMTCSALHQALFFAPGLLHNLCKALLEDVGSDAADCSFLGVGLTPQETSIGVAEHAHYEGSAESLSPETASTDAPLAYLPVFIQYIANVGDVLTSLEGMDTYNYFLLLSQRPSDLLTELVFELGSPDAATRVAGHMGIDLVHRVLAACITPVLPPQARTALFPPTPSGAAAVARQYSLTLDVVKHLATISPLRAVLACVFGLLHRDVEVPTSQAGDSEANAEADRVFLEFALEHSEDYPVLNRWIKLQAHISNIQLLAKAPLISSITNPASITDFPSAESHADVASEVAQSIQVDHVPGGVASRPADLDTGNSPAAWYDHVSLQTAGEQPEKTPDLWEDEVVYVGAVDRLTGNGQLDDALAIADRWLTAGPPDSLLALLVETECKLQDHQAGIMHQEINAEHKPLGWQYCLRLRDKEKAAQLALRYYRQWDCQAALDVLQSCLSQLLMSSPCHNKVQELLSRLHFCADVVNTGALAMPWQQVDELYLKDPANLAQQLAAAGAYQLSIQLAHEAPLPADQCRPFHEAYVVALFNETDADKGGPVAATSALDALGEEAVRVALAALSKLSDLRFKFLLVHYLLTAQQHALTQQQLKKLKRFRLGLKAVMSLPQLWRERCAALHAAPPLILESLLMWQQLSPAQKLLQDFPELQDDSLISLYAAKALSFEYAALPTSAVRSLSDNTMATDVQELSDSSDDADEPLMLPPTDAWEIMSRTHGGVVAALEAAAELVSGGYPSPSSSWGPAVRAEGAVTSNDILRQSFNYRSAPNTTLFKALLDLCSSRAVAARAAASICEYLAWSLLSTDRIAASASDAQLETALDAAEVMLQGLEYAKEQYLLAATETFGSSVHTAAEATATEYLLSKLQLVHKLLGSGVAVAIDDIEHGEQLLERLVAGERYSLAIYACSKCEWDAYPVWRAWGNSLLATSQFAAARSKFQQAIRLRPGHDETVFQTVELLEGPPPLQLYAVRMHAQALDRSFSFKPHDALDAAGYLSVLCLPGTGVADSALGTNVVFGISTDAFDLHQLKEAAYIEGLQYLKDYAPAHVMPYVFRHGRYAAGCELFLPGDSDANTDTVFGTIEELCQFCIGHQAMPELLQAIGRFSASTTAPVIERVGKYLTRHQHYHLLHDLQMLVNDKGGAGLTSVQLFLNTKDLVTACAYLTRAQQLFDDELADRLQHRASSSTGNLTDEELIAYSRRAGLQKEVLTTLNSTPAKVSVFGDARQPHVHKRLCAITQLLLEKNFDLGFQMMYDFVLPPVEVYCGAAQVMVRNKNDPGLAVLFRNIRGTVGDEDRDQILQAAIDAYLECKELQKADKLIGQLSLDTNKVHAFLASGKLRQAYELASKRGYVAEVKAIFAEATNCGRSQQQVADLCAKYLKAIDSRRR
eukprot:jgi/Chlat1/6325/Chrsp44S05889